MNFFKQLLDTGDFMSHGHCYLWDPGLVRLHVWSDLSIGLAYTAISLTLVYLVRRGRRDIPFHWMFLAFGSFIIACGATHLIEVWTVWTPVYWLAGVVKLLTASASVLTAVTLPPLVPKSLQLIRSAKLSEQRQLDLEAANAALEKEIAERKRAEQEIRRLNDELEARVRERTLQLARANEALAEKAGIVQHSSDAIFGMTLDLAVTSWNPAAEKVYGYAAEEIVGKSADVLAPPDRAEELRALVRRLAAGEAVGTFETQRVRKDGETIDVHLTISPMRDTAGSLTGASVIARDITESTRAEKQLRETQRLESLGLIAGGVAHDFNNILVGIMGNASLALETLPNSSRAGALLEHVIAASEKAAALTHQLLAYAGRARFVTEKINLSQLVRDICDLVLTSIPKSARLRLELAENLPAVEADATQIQQVVLNLVINAAEAIGDQQGGEILVATRIRDVDDVQLHNEFAGEPLAPGRYVSLEVQDTGCGMDDALIARIFDPFFTTKFTGRGLGLAAVLGIVRAHKGAIHVYSEPRKGSTFKILLPTAAGEPVSPANGEDPQLLSGSGTILLVDDEEIVRTTARAALEQYGYEVLTAPDGQAGVELFRRHAGSIAAVLLDMTMPVMSGEEALRHMRTTRPDIRVILSSGYSEAEAVRQFGTRGIAGFIQKPYSAAQLARALRRAIHGPGIPPGTTAPGAPD